MSEADPPLPPPPPDDGTSGRADRLDAELAEARVDAAARSRARESSLLRQAGEAATFVGTLADLAERGLPVVAGVAGGRRHQGRVRALGTDFVVIAGGPGGPDDGGEMVVRLAAVTSVRTIAAGAPTGDRDARLDVTLAEVLTSMAADRPRVVLATFDGESLAGELRSAGLDVVQLSLEGSGDTAYVPLTAIAEVVRG